MRNIKILLAVTFLIFSANILTVIASSEYHSETVIPSTIKVAIIDDDYATGTSCDHDLWEERGYPVESIETVDFKEYVTDVLAKEWWVSANTDDDKEPEAFKAGAMAVMNFAWDKMNNDRRDYVGADVLNNTCDQVYIEDPEQKISAHEDAVDAVWGMIMKNADEGIFQANFRRVCGGNNQEDTDGYCMGQEDSFVLAQQGKGWETILNELYFEHDLYIYEQSGNEYSTGDIVQAIAPSSGLNVRDSAGGTYVGTVYTGEVGSILSGPIESTYGASRVYQWYEVRWEDGTEGWSADGQMIPSELSLGDVEPEDGSTEPIGSHTFEWADLNMPAYEFSYEYETDEGTTSEEFIVFSPEKVIDLYQDGTVKWKVRAVLQSSPEWLYGAWSETYTFYVDSSAGICVFSKMSEDSDTDVCGVDFSAAALSGISVDPETNNLEFVVKATEAGDSDTIIDLDEDVDEIKKIFLQALAVPNNKQWISLDILMDDDGNYYGSSRVEAAFKETDIVRIFFEADVAMKFDLFTDPINGESLDEGHSADWVELIQSSDYWEEIEEADFNAFPDWMLRGAIIPGEISASEEEGIIWLNEAELDLEYEIVSISIDLSEEALSEELQAEIQTLLIHYETLLFERLEAGATDLIDEINGGAEAYADLRRIYPVIAAAQWYKEIDLENKPYQDLIDSEDLTGIESDQAFDDEFWDGEAFQYLTTERWTGYYGSTWSGEMYGGVVLSDLDLGETGEITSDDEEIIDDALNGISSQNEDDYFLSAGTTENSLAELLIIDFDLGGENFVQDEFASIEIEVSNQGVEAAITHSLSVYHELESDGETLRTLIQEISVSELEASESEVLSFTWAPSSTGEQSFIFQVDSAFKVTERNELNNEIELTFDVYTNAPILSIHSPENYSLIYSDEITFEGHVFDFIDFPEDPEMTWTSDVDGELGTGYELTVEELTLGTHTITLETTNSSGVSSSKEIRIEVIEEGYPAVSIQSPEDQASLSGDIAYAFSVSAEDISDGDLCDGENENAQDITLSWTSSLDGTLGATCDIDTQLSLGTHDLTFSATNTAGNTSESTIEVEVTEAEPTLLITSPADYSDYDETESITLIATASDNQDGDISSNITWTSGLDGDLGTGASLTQTLTPGTHTITSVIIDSNGFSDEAMLTLTVDYTPPTISITGPTEDSEFDYEEEITLTASASDAQDGTLTGDSISWSSSIQGDLGTGESLTVSNLYPGTHTLTATAIDSDAQETSTNVLGIFIDAGAPEVTLLSPNNDDTFYYSETISFSGSATDETDGTLTGSSLLWESSLDGSLGTGTSLSLDSLSSGTHIIRLTATDSDGWSRSESISITVEEPQAPILSLSSPKNNAEYNNGETLTLKASASDPEDGDISGNIIWESDLDGALGTGSEITELELSEGTHTLTATIEDSHGAEVVATLTLEMLNNAPEVSISSPDDSSIIQEGDSIDFTASASDYENGALSGASITWSSSKDGSLGTGATLSTDSLSTGVHQITVTAIDSDGSAAESQITITVQSATSILLSTFEDGSESLSLELTADTEDTQYIALPHDANVQSAEVEVIGLEGEEIIWEREEYGTLDGEYKAAFLIGKNYPRPAFFDYDGDGDKDLFVGDSLGEIWLYENNGNNDFTYVTESFEDIDIGKYSRLSFSDYDGDGDEDLFVGNFDGEISHYENDGDQNFTYITDSFESIDVWGYANPSFSDYDGDGDEDLFIGDNDGDVWLYENDGSGSFTYITDQFENIDVLGQAAPSFSDYDGDGDEDLFVGGWYGDIALYESNGSGGFSYITSTFESINLDHLSAPSFSDYDGDGDEDLFVGGSYGVVQLYENDGSGSFAYVSDIFESIDVVGSTSPSFSDYDGDGDEDLFIGEIYGEIWHYESDSTVTIDLTFIDNSFETIDVGNRTSPSFSDYDGDGDEDLFSGNLDGEIWLYENDGSGNFTYITDSFESIDVGSYSKPTFSDHDGDGDEDLFIGEYYGEIWLYENDGSGNFTYTTDSFESIDVGNFASPSFSDYDRDGDKDLFIGETNGRIWFYENDGSENYNLVTRNFASIGLGNSSYVSPTFFDYDGDGDEDLFVGESSGGLLLYLNQGYATPTNPSLDVTSNGTDDWSYSGEFTDSEVTDDFAQALNTYLAQDSEDLTFDSNDNVLIPLTLLSEADGTLELSNLSVQYEIYDLDAPTIDSSELTPNPALTTESPTFNVTASDNTGVDTVTFTVEEDTTLYTLVDHNDGTYSTSLNLSNLNMDAAGTYEIHLTVTDEAGLETTETLELTVIEAGIDMALQDLAIEDNFSELTATFLNLGNTDQTGVNYTLYLADTELDSGSFDLTAGESTAWSLSSPFNEEDHEPGTQTLTLILDEDDDLSETDEDNNILTLDIWIEDTEAPVIDSISLEENPVTQDEEAIFYVTATDNLEIDSVSVSWQDEEETLTYDETNEYYTGSITAANTGTTSATITVTDTQGLTAQGSIDVEVLELSPDLSINDFSIEVDGSTITLSLLNEGPQSATDVDVKFEIDGTHQETQSFSLDGFAETDLTFDWSPSSSDLTFTVDPDDTITELDESNNQASTSVSLPPSSPPTIESFTFSPNPAVESADITLEVELSVDSADPSGDEYVFVEWTTSGATETLTYDEDSGLFTATTSTENTGDQELTLIAARSQSAYEASQPIYSQQAETIEVLADAAELEITDFSAILWADADEDGLNDNTLENSDDASMLLEAGETYELLLTIENSGSQDASTNTLGFSISGTSEDSQSLTLSSESSDDLSFIWTPQLGAHSLEFTIDSDEEITERDETNNTLTQSLTAYDFTAPTLTNIEFDETIYEGMSISLTIEGEDNEEIAGASITLDGTTTDLTLSSDEYVETEDDDGRTITTHSATYEGTVTAPAEGDETLTFTLTDSSGLTATTSRAIEIHSINPDFTIDDFSLDYEAPLEEDLETEFSVDVTNQGGSDSSVTVALQIDGSTVDSSTQTIAKGETQTLTFTYTGVYGDHELSIVADPSGLVTEGDETNNEITRDIYVFDALAPEAPTLTVSPSDWTDDPDYTLSWTTVSDARGIDYFEYRINQGEWVNNASSTSASLTADEDGIHVIEVRAVDNAANEGDTATGYFKLDTTVPETPILLGPANPDNASKDTTPYFYWNNPGDHGGGVQEYEVFTGYFSVEDKEASETDDTITPTVTTSNTSDENHQPTLTEDGFYTLKIRAIDALENNSDWSNEITIQLDTTAPDAPEITSTTHTESTWSSSKTPEFEWIEPADDTSISGYYYIFDQDSETTVTTSGMWTEDSSISMSALPVMTEEPVEIPDGNWYFHLVAKDELGHLSEADTYEILIDSVSPYVDLILPDEMDYAPLSIELEGYDADSGLEAIHYTLNTGEITLAQDGDTINITGSEEQYNVDPDYAYVIAYYAIDIAGNSTETSTYKFDVLGTSNVDFYTENPSLDSNKLSLTYTIGNSGEDDGPEGIESQTTYYLDDEIIFMDQWGEHEYGYLDFSASESSKDQTWYMVQWQGLRNLSTNQTYTLETCANGEHSIMENSFSDNCSELDWTYNGELPDLKARVMNWDQSTEEITYRLGNSGELDLSDFTKGRTTISLDDSLLVTENWSDLPSTTFLLNQTMEEFTYDLSSLSLDPGIHSFEVCIDSTNEVAADENYKNNCHEMRFVYLTASGPVADLTVQNSVYNEETQALSYTLLNQGYKDESIVANGMNGLYLNIITTKDELWNTHPAQATTYLTSGGFGDRTWYLYETTEWAGISYGSSFTVGACIDKMNVVTEYDELNNCEYLTQSYDGKRPNLTAEIASIEEGSYALNYALGNDGEVGVNKDLDGRITITLDGTQINMFKWKNDASAQDYLQAGSETIKNYALDTSSLTSGSSYTVEVCVDSTNKIKGEHDNTDNCDSLSFTY
jgi:hypothetical protein